LRQGFSTRCGGVSSPPAGSLNLGYMDWDIAERVEENRLRFLSALGLVDNSLATLTQVHSDQVHIIKRDTNQRNCRLDGDALLTRDTDVALAVRVGDCLPVLLADPDNRAIGVVHAGWRGILAHILVKTVEMMREAFGSDPGRLIAALGPGIRSCCMEVDPEVACLFEREFPDHRLCRLLPGYGGKSRLDLKQALECDRSVAGIDRGNFYDLGLCTHCTPAEFFSYRREGPASGRMMAAIGMTD